ncbi:alpha/beta-hydrolase [Rhypophila decipiens]|uniref:Alpha/beta-hydrolase n=1 Tax=Rhypophila decipiens TaxID=261697 RepID=A0AAN7B1Z7_9PEZI|nr:alpha/beta-hydrolase [Rhypophila decipiens]
MSSTSEIFHIKEHTVEAQHIREYPRATANSQEEVLHLALKQYIPKNNPTPQPGDVTILASHANGFVKELYEPLWEDLVEALGKSGVRVRSIWIADVAWQGQSGILNQDKLGYDPSWLDHARDLLHAVNTFRKEMPRPLIGVGHSFGANTLINLSLLHPRLLTSIICLDPVVSRYKFMNPRWGLLPMKSSANRRDLWPSLPEAISSFAKNPFYATWDPRVTEKWNQYGLRKTPTRLYPSPEDADMVTLATSKHMEVVTYYRPQDQSFDPKTGKRVVSPNKKIDRSKLPDAEPTLAADFGDDFVFYRPEGPTTADRLPNLRPGVLYIFGETSNVNPPDIRQEKADLTGAGVGGSGGVAKGRVEIVTLEKYGHLVPLEATTRCAQLAGDFIKRELERSWKPEEEEYQAWVEGNSLREKQTLGREYDVWLGGGGGQSVNGVKKGAKL